MNMFLAVTRTQLYLQFVKTQYSVSHSVTNRDSARDRFRLQIGFVSRLSNIWIGFNLTKK